MIADRGYARLKDLAYVLENEGNAFPPDVEPQPGQQATVIIVENNRCYDRLITVKSIEGDQVRIASGLLGGDKVIIAPPPNLKTGDAVTVR